MQKASGERLSSYPSSVPGMAKTAPDLMRVVGANDTARSLTDARIRFERAVTVKVRDQERTIRYLADAGQILLREWPIESEKKRVAMHSIRRALAGGIPFGSARGHFVVAALEARILVQD